MTAGALVELPRREQREAKPQKAPGAAAAAKLRQALGPLADVREPGQAEEPILAEPVRRALFEWLAEIRAADEMKAMGLRPRSTALLYGPPGTGKTTLAHHLAARLGIPMVVVGPENIAAPYHGESERNLAKLFRTLDDSRTPCLLFMDELEALGGHRNKNKAGGADNARTAEIGILLRKIEEYQSYFIGATNRRDDIDPALWRRLHLQLSVDLPGPDERFAIMRRYGAPFVIGDDDMDLFVELTEGASPALLRGLMEGIKRALVVWPRINRPVDRPEPIIASIVTALAPPPELGQPPLWLPGGPSRLADIDWPPVRGA